jgi:hypothetical protein
MAVRRYDSLIQMFTDLLSLALQLMPIPRTRQKSFHGIVKSKVAVLTEARLAQTGLVRCIGAGGRML